MKENKSKKGLASRVGAIVILAIAAFAFIYVPGMTQSTANTIVYGKYDGTKITDRTPLFSSSLQQIYTQLEQSGQTIGVENYLSILNEAFTSTVMFMTYQTEVEKTNFIPSENAITDRMLQYISSQTDNVSEYVNGMSNAEKNTLYEAAKEDLIINRYIEDYIGSQNGLFGIKSTDAEAEFIKNMNINQRSFDMVAFSKDSFPASEIITYANENQDLFVKYNLSAITNDNENTLKTTLDQINKNEITFEDAIAYSTTSNTDQTGKYLNNQQYQLQTTFTNEADFNVVTNLKVGELSGVVKTNTGYAIFRCDSEATSPDFTDEATLDAVKLYMKAYEAGVIEDYFITLAEDFSADAISMGFNKAAEEVYGVTPSVVSSFPINYGNSSMLSILPTNSELANIQNNEVFFDVAFGIEENEISTPMVIGNDIIVLKLKEEVSANPVDDFAYMYYSSSFDEYSIRYSVTNNDKVENNVTQAYFQLLSSNNG